MTPDGGATEAYAETSAWAACHPLGDCRNDATHGDVTVVAWRPNYQLGSLRRT